MSVRVLAFAAISLLSACGAGVEQYSDTKPSSTLESSKAQGRVMGSAGTTYRTYGNTTRSSDGTTWRTYGNTTRSSDGTTWRTYGNTSRSSDGTVCRTYGSTTRCN